MAKGLKDFLVQHLFVSAILVHLLNSWFNLWSCRLHGRSYGSSITSCWRVRVSSQWIASNVLLLTLYWFIPCLLWFVVVMNATPIVVAAVAVVVDTIPVQQAPSGKKLKKRPKGKSEWVREILGSVWPHDLERKPKTTGCPQGSLLRSSRKNQTLVRINELIHK